LFIPEKSPYKVKSYAQGIANKNEMNKYRRGIGGLLNPLIIYQSNLKIILKLS
jgi:hypothetical protein